MMDTRDMKSGRELDCKIAELMGWTGLWTDGKHFMMYSPCEQSLGVGYDERSEIPHYSTDISLAWEVVEKMRTKNYLMNTFDQLDTKSGIVSYGVSFYDYMKTGREAMKKDENMSTAICRAALLAMEGNVMSDNGYAVRGTMRLLQRGDITLEQTIEIVNMWIELTAKKSYNEGELDGRRSNQKSEKEWQVMRDYGSVAEREDW